MKPQITLPIRTGTGETETYTSQNNLVIIGANGAGKTRLGSRIESQNQDNVTVHRISAQRALNIPNYATVKSLEQAQKWLLYGREDEIANVGHKLGHRWANNPDLSLLDDYNQLLSTLFAKSAKRNDEHTKETREKQTYIPVPDAPIDIIVRLWKDIMPQREIIFDDSKIIAKTVDGQEYHGKEMSDGERVALYLMGQCLSAPENSVVIIDEPEIHLHKSLMARLWNRIEEECPNKLLIFITHDLDFAASRKEANKIWIERYDGGRWIWHDLPEIEEIPENLVIEIAGNRKNVIFIEGEKVSYDSILYQAVFPDYHIIPRGSCEKVIESTKAVNDNPSLHHVKAYGIIDSDYRTEAEITALKEAGIYTIDVAEVENLFCIEPLLRIVAANQNLPADQIVQDVTNFVIRNLRDEFDNQVSNHAEREIQFRLNAYKKNSNSEQGLQDGFTALMGSINIPLIYEQSREIFQNAIDENSLEKALRIYNRKSLPKRISGIFRLKEGEYVELVLRLLKSKKKDEIVRAIKVFTPTFN